MAEYGLVDTFGIDHGELDHLERNECFTLGVEWQMFREQIDCGKSFERMIHSANEDRLAALAEKYGYAVEHVLENDSWTTLKCRKIP